MNCRKCKNWKDCKGRECLICGTRTLEFYCEPCKAETQLIRKSWYHYGEIRWCPFQTMWLFQNADILHDGKWPPELEQPNKAGRSQLRGEGHFVKPKIAIGELEKRLETTGTAGALLREQCENGKTLEELHPEAYSVLMYVSGRSRKKMSHRAWQRYKRWNKARNPK